MKLYKMTDVQTAQHMHIDGEQLADMAFKISGNKVTMEVIERATDWYKKVDTGELVEFNFGNIAMTIVEEKDNEIINRFVAQLQNEDGSKGSTTGIRSDSDA